MKIVLLNVIVLITTVLTVFVRSIFIYLKFWLGCPCHADCVEGCAQCENPICNCKVCILMSKFEISIEVLIDINCHLINLCLKQIIKDSHLQDDWQNCTNEMCPMLTSCILECDSMDCKMECVQNFETNHQNCPCEVNDINLSVRSYQQFTKYETFNNEFAWIHRNFPDLKFLSFENVIVITSKYLEFFQ